MPANRPPERPLRDDQSATQDTWEHDFPRMSGDDLRWRGAVAPPRRRSRRRWWTVGLLALAIVIGAVLVAQVLVHHSKGVDALTGGAPVASGTSTNNGAPKPGQSLKPSGSTSPSAGGKTPSPSPKTQAPTTKSTPPKNGPPITESAIPNRPNCAPTPSSCGLPDATNTGVPGGTSLTVVNGDVSVTKAGTVLQNKDIRGCVNVEAANVTIRDTKISCTDYYGVSSFTNTNKGGNLLIEDSEIDCKNHNTTGVGSFGFTAKRLNIHGCENGFDVDTDVTVEDSYIHDLYEGATGHADGVQLSIGQNLTVRHNTIFNPGGTSAMISNGTKISNVLVVDNLFSGGAYTLYCPTISSTNFRVINNRFSKLYGAKGGEYGAMADCGSNIAQLTGNVWDSNLQPVHSD